MGIVADCCEHPRKVFDANVAGGFYFVRCFSRFAGYCSYCAYLNQLDYREIISSGFIDNGDYEFYAVTLSAESFGRVHGVGNCGCGESHEGDDLLIGTPLNERYFYKRQAEWNLQFKKLLNYTLKNLRSWLDCEFVVVREWQRRGVLHVHILIRVSSLDKQDLVLRALRRLRVVKLNGFGWGRSFDVDRLGSDLDGLSDVASYFVKSVGATSKQQGDSYGILSEAQRKHFSKVERWVKSLSGNSLSDKAIANLGWSGHVITFSDGWSFDGLSLKVLQERRKEWAKNNNKAEVSKDFARMEEIYKENNIDLSGNTDLNFGTGSFNESRLDGLLGRFEF